MSVVVVARGKDKRLGVKGQECHLGSEGHLTSRYYNYP